MTRTYFVYILANASHMLYVGVTNDLQRRLSEHRGKTIPGYARQYGLTQLIYYESTPDIRSAIQREKQIKGWNRARKIALIESHNPGWADLSTEGFAPPSQ